MKSVAPDSYRDKDRKPWWEPIEAMPKWVRFTDVPTEDGDYLLRVPTRFEPARSYCGNAASRCVTG